MYHPASKIIYTSISLLFLLLISPLGVHAQGASNNFSIESAQPKYGKTWIATITCRTADGTTATLGNKNPYTISGLVAQAIRQKNLPYVQPTEPLVRSDGGTLHTPTLNAACRILGYESHVSSTCLDNEVSGNYKNGKCNFHTPENNQMFRFNGIVDIDPASPAIAITKTAPISVNQGENISYTITVTNTGTAIANGILVEDTADSRLTFVPVGSTAGCQFASGKVSCTIPSIAAGGNSVITLVFQQPTTPLVCETVLNNTANAFSPSPVIQSSNNNFNVESAEEKYEKTWVATITCLDSTGAQTIIGDNKPPTLVRLVAEAIEQQNLPFIKPIHPFLRSTGGKWTMFAWWNKGTEDVQALNAICQVLGYRAYWKSTCPDEQRKWPYFFGKCNFHSPEDNQLTRFAGTIDSSSNYTSAPATATATTTLCSLPENQPPVAVAEISVDGGKTYSSNVTVTQFLPVDIRLSGSKSSDPDGWDTPGKGVSDPKGLGKCEFNSELNKGDFTSQTVINHPANPDKCTYNVGKIPFFELGSYTYNLLRITDAGGALSNIGTATVNVVKPSDAEVTVNLRVNGSSDPAPGIVNTPITLGWTSTNADTCTASSTLNEWTGTKIINGTEKTTPKQVRTYTYTLACKNTTTGKEGKHSVSIDVKPLPVNFDANDFLDTR